MTVFEFTYYYFLFHFFALVFLEDAFAGHLKKNRKQPCLSDTLPVDFNFFDLTTQFVEYCILGRYSFCGYKNHVRSNLRIFSALFTTVSVTLFVLCTVKIVPKNSYFNETVFSNPNAPLAIATMFISTFILERTHLHKKWEYLADLYNLILQVDIKEKDKYQIMRTALVLDAIQMEMWSHRSYKKIFESVLLDSYKEVRGETISRETLLAMAIEKQEAYDLLEQRLTQLRKPLSNKQKQRLKIA